MSNRPQSAKDIHDLVDTIKNGPHIVDVARDMIDDTPDTAAIVAGLGSLELIATAQLRALALILERLEDKS